MTKKNTTTKSAAAQTATTTAEQTTATTQQAVKATPPVINLADIDLAARVIAVAVKRGVYEAGEVSVVGTIYDKLIAFLNYQKAVQEAAQAQAKPKGE